MQRFLYLWLNKYNMKEKKYTLTVTESQLLLIANCVEDCHRFAAGEMDMWNTTAFVEKFQEMQEGLDNLKELMTPELPHMASYGWDGGSCRNKLQKKFIARTYAIYREIYHRLRVINPNECYSVYDSSTLTCDEGGELPEIELVG